MDLRRLAPIAARQHGLLTLDQHSATGLSPRAWCRAIERGDLEPLHPGVARLVGPPPSREQRILAGVLTVRRSRAPPERVLASHRSTAYLLGLDRPADDPVDVTVVGADHRRRLDGVVVHRPSVLADLAPTTRRGIRCTNELRTLVDLGAVDPAAVAGALDRFAVTRRISPAVVQALIERHARPGRTGVTALRQALADWPIDDGIPDGRLEVAMARLLRDHGLPPAMFHPRIAGYEVDVAIDGSPVVVECDGWTYHGADRDQWEYDRDRDAVLHAAGRVVLRRSRRQIVHEPTATANHISALLERWSPHLLPRASLRHPVTPTVTAVPKRRVSHGDMSLTTRREGASSSRVALQSGAVRQPGDRRRRQTMANTTRTTIGWLVVAGLVAAGCSGGSDDDLAVDAAPDTTTTSSTVPPGTLGDTTSTSVATESTTQPTTEPGPTIEAAPTRCDPEAAADADEPITVRMWHALNGDIVNYLLVLVGQFEAEHPGIQIEIEKIVSGYPGTIDEFVATPDDQLPDVIIGTNQTARLQADSGRFIPVSECTGGETPDNLTDLLPVIERTFTVDGVLWAAPFNTSAPVMLYDRKRWARAGLDPDDPPSDLDELEAAIRQLRDSGEAPIGALLYDRSAMWFLDQPAARTDRFLAEPANGRAGLDVDRFVFETPEAVDVLTRLHTLYQDGYIRWIGVNESGLDDLSQMVHPVEPAGITFNTSAVLGDIIRLLDAGGIPDVEVGAAPLPGPGAGSTAGGGAWWLHDRGDPVQAGAAWTVIDWFTRPELIADVAAYTGYVPTTARAADHPITQARWAEYPFLRAAHDQLAAVPDSDAGAGLQVGPLVEVYRNLELAAFAAIEGGSDPAEELRQAEQRSLEIARIYADSITGR